MQHDHIAAVCRSWLDTSSNNSFSIETLALKSRRKGRDVAALRSLLVAEEGTNQASG